MSIHFTVDDILAFAQKIDLPFPVRERVARLASPDFLTEHRPYCEGLVNPDTAFVTWEKLKTLAGGADPEGMRLLTIYLAAACLTRDEYCAAGISDAVFWDTMACFSRFLLDEHLHTGIFAFTRGFWAWRHLSCRLFRLGTLEFEYALLEEHQLTPKGMGPGEPVLFVHIPSDAKLTEAALADSYRAARRFFTDHGAQVCPAGAPQAVLCHTWLLSPTLQTLLAPTSGIRRFAQDYTVLAVDTGDESFYLWLFHGKKPPEPLPLETSLQRVVCDYLQRGGKIGAAYGIQSEWVDGENS